MRRIHTQPPTAFVRRGVSLIELMVTLVVAGVILTMGIGMLHLLLQTDDHLHHSLKRRQMVSQLSDAFRRDVHEARHVTWNQPQGDDVSRSVTLQLAPDHEVQYAAKDHTLIRTETRNQATLQTARFGFSLGTEIVFEPRTAKTIAVVIRNHNTNPNSPRRIDPDAPKRELIIEAVTGRDHRFEKTKMP